VVLGQTNQAEKPIQGTVAAAARVAYAPPRIIEVGKIRALTFGSTGTQGDGDMGMTMRPPNNP